MWASTTSCMCAWKPCKKKKMCLRRWAQRRRAREPDISHRLKYYCIVLSSILVGCHDFFSRLRLISSISGESLLSIMYRSQSSSSLSSSPSPLACSYKLSSCRPGKKNIHLCLSPLVRVATHGDASGKGIIGSAEMIFLVGRNPLFNKNANLNVI